MPARCAVASRLDTIHGPAPACAAAMLSRGILTSCNHYRILLCAVLLRSTEAYAIPRSQPPPLLVSRDDLLPPRATALNVFAALFTILVLVILAMWIVMRLINKALTNLSATVTGSSSTSTSGTGETSTTLS